MKLCVVTIGDVSDKWIGEALASIRASFHSVLRPDTEVTLKPARGGLKGNNYLDFDNPYFVLLNKRPIVEALIEADKEGFDAAWVNCFGDPGVPEARAVVRMPIIGPCEATLHLACQLGRKFAIIAANMPGQIAQVEEQVRQHGLEGRLIANGVRTEKEPFGPAYEKGLRDPRTSADSVSEVARQCVIDGADVVVIGCCGIGPILSSLGFNKLTFSGQEIPILDPVMVAAKMTEMAADIRNKTGLPLTSRTRNYVTPGRNDLVRVRSHFGLPH